MLTALRILASRCCCCQPSHSWNGNKTMIRTINSSARSTCLGAKRKSQSQQFHTLNLASLSFNNVHYCKRILTTHTNQTRRPGRRLNVLDPYDRYRPGFGENTGKTVELIQEIQLETKRTLANSAVDRNIYQNFYQEISKAAATVDLNAKAHVSVGPTGEYIYQWLRLQEEVLNDSEHVDSASSSTRVTKRVYQRQKIPLEGYATELVSDCVKITRPSGPSSSTTFIDNDTEPEVVFEINEEIRMSTSSGNSEHAIYTDLVSFSLCADETMIAYVIFVRDGNDPTRAGKYQIWVRDIASGTSEEVLNWDTYGIDELVQVEFGRMDKASETFSLFFLLSDKATGRPYKVEAATMGKKNSGLAVNVNTKGKERQHPDISAILECSDPSVHVEMQRLKGCADGNFSHVLAINKRRLSDNEVYLVGDVENGLHLVRARETGLMYNVDMGREASELFIAAHLTLRATNQDTAVARGETSNNLEPEITVFQTAIDNLPIPCGGQFGQTIAKSENGYAIDDVDVFRNYLVVYERSTLDGTERLRVKDRNIGGEDWIVPFPNQPWAHIAMIAPAVNVHYEALSFQFYLDCPCVPRQIFMCNTKTRSLVNLSTKEREGASPTTRMFRNRRVLIRSLDGTRVPLTIVQKRLSTTKEQPVLLLAYGSYGRPLSIGFDPALQPLLDRGYAIAYAHTRGGGDLGKSWHHQGKHLGKVKAVEDYIACAKALKTSPLLDLDGSCIRLVGKGFSAGGIPVGTTLASHPDLFDTVVLTNAFLDVKVTMSRPDLPLTQHEWDEFGNPTTDNLDSIEKYCPVSAIPKTSLQSLSPRVLLIGTLDDNAVPFWNTLVFGKKLRNLFSSNNEHIFMYVEGNGGHNLGANRTRVAALEAAFIASGKWDD